MPTKLLRQIQAIPTAMPPDAKHTLDPRVRLALALTLIVVTSLTPPSKTNLLLLNLVVVILSAFWAKLSLTRLFRRSLLIVPFVLFFALLLPFNTPGPVALRLDLPPLHLAASEPGLRLAAALFMRSYNAMWIALLLIASADFTQLSAGLRSLYVPRIILILIDFSHRYSLVIQAEARRLHQAYTARSAGGQMPWLRRLNVVAGLIGQLFLRSLARSERIHQAMLARGFSGQMPSTHLAGWRARDLQVLIAGLAYSTLYAALLWA